MSLNEGRYASADVQPEVLGDLSASVVEQVDAADATLSCALTSSLLPPGDSPSRLLWVTSVRVVSGLSKVFNSSPGIHRVARDSCLPLTTLC